MQNCVFPLVIIVMEDPAWLIKLVLIFTVILLSGIYFRIFSVKTISEKMLTSNEAIEQKEIYYTPPSAPISWVEKLKNDLAVLKLSNYMQQREQAILKFDSILSEYLSKRWDIRSGKLTTLEIIHIAKSGPFSANDIERLNILLTQADLIKFSQVLPRELDWQHLFALFEEALTHAEIA